VLYRPKSICKLAIGGIYRLWNERAEVNVCFELTQLEEGVCRSRPLKREYRAALDKEKKLLKGERTKSTPYGHADGPVFVMPSDA